MRATSARAVPIFVVVQVIRDSLNGRSPELTSFFQLQNEVGITDRLATEAGRRHAAQTHVPLDPL
jgi:hypothetical protein